MLTDNDGNLYRRRLGEFPRRYLVDLGSDRSPRASFEDQSRQHYVQLPEEVAQLVREEIPDIERWRNMSAPVAASSIRDWLHARCDYALHDLADPLPGRAGDLRAFLFGNERQRRGHCQYFTTASVVLMRASGHPARPVLGYASDEFGENEITFRALHAHAWGEFLRSNDGLWQRFDTTPAGGLAQRSDGVDLHQEDEWEDQAFAPEQDPEEELAAAVAMRQWWWWLLLAVPGFLGLILIIRHLRRLQAIDPHQRCMAKHRNELLRCAQDCGVSIEASTTLSSIAEELSQASGVDLNQTLRQHLAARFGSGPLPEPWPIKEIRQAYAQRQQRRPDSPESA
ncbi:MAG: transglutaminase domain-containing protein, partial [Planctomycetota bacterium]